MNENQYVSIKFVMGRYDISRSTVYNWINLGENGFPSPLKFGYNTRWSLKALLEWEEAQPIYGNAA